MNLNTYLDIFTDLSNANKKIIDLFIDNQTQNSETVIKFREELTNWIELIKKKITDNEYMEFFKIIERFIKVAFLQY